MELMKLVETHHSNQVEIYSVKSKHGTMYEVVTNIDTNRAYCVGALSLKTARVLAKRLYVWSATTKTAFEDFLVSDKDKEISVRIS